MKKRAQRSAIGGALCLLLVGVGTSEAGIVILKRGRVYVGVVRGGDVTSEGVWLNRPNGEQGRVWFPKKTLRWFDAKAKVPTEGYFRRFAGQPLVGKRWKAMDLAWRQAQLRGEVKVLPPVVPKPRDLDMLSPVPVAGKGYTLKKPWHWKVRSEDGILMLVAPWASQHRGALRGKTKAFRTRVHAFAVDTASATEEKRLEWIQSELRRLAAGFGVAFRVVRQHPPRAGEGGTWVVLETRTHLKGRTITAIRKVVFGARRTFVITAYVDDRDAAAAQSQLEAILRSFRVAK